MKIKQIRNATLRIEYAGQALLVDPWLAAKGSLGSFADIPDTQMTDPTNLHSKMPLVELPETKEAILQGIDAYLLTHLHPDHFDFDPATGIAGQTLDKHVPLFVQNESEAKLMRQSGFQKVMLLRSAGSRFGDLTITKTPACHGTETPCGPACGLILQSPQEKTLYIAGDTIWYEGVAQTLAQYRPDVIILNACAASLVGFGRLIMNEKDILQVHRACPNSHLIASHMDTVAHALLTRQTLREKLAALGILGQVRIPTDGETIAF